MKILVCVKQVPDTEKIKVDPVTGSLIRDGVPSILNPLDENAVEAALRLKEQYGAEVTAVTMGPPQAEAILRDCLAVGADQAVLLTDRAFKDSDTLATSYALACVARQLGPFDLILCGKNSLDGETGQVGPELAEHLNFNQVTSVSHMELVNEKLRAVREMDDGTEIVLASLPSVCTVVRKNYEPRKATMRGKLAAKKNAILTLSASAVDGLRPEEIGAQGSPTSVSRSFVPEPNEPGLMLNEGSCELNAKKLVSLLVAGQTIEV